MVYTPIILIDLEFTAGTIYRSTRDVVIGGVAYHAGLIDFPEISEQLNDIWYGVENSSRVKLSFVNEDNDVDDTWATTIAAEDPRGLWVKIQRYTVEDATTTFQFYGKITQAELTDEKFIINVEMRDDEILETLLPQHVVTTDLFDTTALDIGQPVNICFGHCYNVPLRNIQNDTTNNEYDYLIGYGTIEGLNTASGYGVKRDGVLVDSEEYSAYDGSNNPGGVYTGYAFIRFTTEQRDYGRRFHHLTADVKGLELGDAAANRDFADVIKGVLNNATWGLGQSVDATTFATAVTALSTIGDMYCDGAITEQRRARYILNDLLFPARAVIERGSDKEWEISIDGTGSSVLTLGDNDGFYNNVKQVIRRRFPSTSQSARNIILHYDMERYIDRETPFKEINEAVRAAFGEDKTYELPFVSEDDTALKVVGYLEGYELYGTEYITLDAEIEAKDLNRGDVFTLTVPRLGVTSQTYKVTTIRRNNKDRFYIEGRKYSISIYSNSGTTSAPTGQTIPTTTVTGPYSDVAPRETKTADFNAISGHRYNIDTTSGEVEMTLPATPTVADKIYWWDLAANFETYNFIIRRNGKKIEGESDDMTCRYNFDNGVLEYTGSTYGWRLL